MNRSDAMGWDGMPRWNSCPSSSVAASATQHGVQSRSCLGRGSHACSIESVLNGYARLGEDCSLFMTARYARTWS